MARDKTDKTDKTSAAIAFAEEQVKDFLKSEPLNRRSGRCRLSYYLWWKLRLKFADGPDGSYIEIEDNAARALCVVALEHAGARSLLIDVIASRIRNGTPLSADLRKFAFLALYGELPKPKAVPGPKPTQRFERDLFIIWTLAQLTADYGVPPTEADERDPSRRPNGMGILAKCFQDCGRHEITARVIKEVWLDKRKRNWADRIEAEMDDYIDHFEKLPRNALAAWHSVSEIPQ